MSIDIFSDPSSPEAALQGELLEGSLSSPFDISLQEFVSEFGDELLESLNRANPPVYGCQARSHREHILACLRIETLPFDNAAKP
ncbi:DEAD-like helicase [Methylocaldum marinum]|uniref:DEAD-like helicase n=1 Tax=Methylocaldum marinum TaxID=1432792 RepID=A0A250KQW2_9GAMM|nr:hypothetical protein [Methylocaldum marinum]BBA34050.1 DEAD-like helicase [Methylocaldum marinum]